MVVSIALVQSVHNFFMNAVLIIIYLNFATLLNDVVLCNLLTRHENISAFTCRLVSILVATYKVLILIFVEALVMTVLTEKNV
jgi:hypothetical protein